MSLCSQCGHNSVFHRNDACKGHLQDLPAGEITWERIQVEAPVCPCALSPWDAEFTEGYDEKWQFRPGYPKTAA